MTIVDIIFYVIVYTCVSFGLLGSIFYRGFNESGDKFPTEMLNPIWIYNHTKVNIFGCILLTVLFNVICPIVTFGYWFYKLCTVGRKR